MEKEEMREDGLVRLSTVEVFPEYPEEYFRYTKEAGEISLKTEPGVLTMYALADKENPCKITILENYSSKAAYRSNIASAHFQKYKTATLSMVKSLALCDQTPLNPKSRITNFIAG